MPQEDFQNQLFIFILPSKLPLINNQKDPPPLLLFLPLSALQQRAKNTPRPPKKTEQRHQQFVDNCCAFYTDSSIFCFSLHVDQFSFLLRAASAVAAAAANTTQQTNYASAEQKAEAPIDASQYFNRYLSTSSCHH